MRSVCYLDGILLFWWVDETKWDDKLWGEQGVSWKGHRGKITLIAGITLPISSIYPCRGQGHTDSSLLLRKKCPQRKCVLNEWQYIMLLFLQRALERIIEVCWGCRDSFSRAAGSIMCVENDVQSFSNQKYKILTFSMLTRPGFTECEASLFVQRSRTSAYRPQRETEEEVREGEKDG